MCFNYTDSSSALANFAKLVDLHRDPYYCSAAGATVDNCDILLAFWS